MCLNNDNFYHQTIAQLVDTPMMTLNEFYSKLEDAKEEETHTHTIPSHLDLPNKVVNGKGFQFVHIPTLSGNNLELNPEFPETKKAYRVQADNISIQCSNILGYRWRYVCFNFVSIVAKCLKLCRYNDTKS